MIPKTIFHGIVRGNSIEMDEPLPFANGESVTIEIQPERASGDGIRASAEAWADAGEELDQWLDQVYRARQAGRSTTIS